MAPVVVISVIEKILLMPVEGESHNFGVPTVERMIIEKLNEVIDVVNALEEHHHVTDISQENTTLPRYD